MGSPKYQDDGDPRTSGPGFALTLHPEQFEIPYRWRAPRTVFVNSMSDLFHPDVPLEFIRRVFTVMAETRGHTYQILTKRSKRLTSLAGGLEWPAKVWTRRERGDQPLRLRIDRLRAVGAAVRFVSAEPLLCPPPDLDLSGLHWLIAGGESGPRARPMRVAWVRDLRDQCAAAGIPFFFKQWGGHTPKAGGRELNGSYHDEMPVVARGLTNGSPSAVAAPAGVMSFEIVVRGFWVAI